jgi:Gpi18-like mannosyltransferase
MVVMHGKSERMRLTLLAFGLLPTTVFFRMAYGESLFVLAVVLLLYGIARRQPLWLWALVAGAATAIRPVGVALLPPLACAAWQRSSSASRGVPQLGWILPLGCWGLALYVLY